MEASHLKDVFKLKKKTLGRAHYVPQERMFLKMLRLPVHTHSCLHRVFYVTLFKINFVRNDYIWMRT